MNSNNLDSKIVAAERFVGWSRRHFLRGLGACLALPAFQSLKPITSLAAESVTGRGLATTASGAPLRTAFVYFPNGAIPSSWWPSQDGANYAFNRTIKPLESHRQVIQL